VGISEQLREAIRESEKSVTAIAADSQIPQPMLTRFVNGKDIRLQTADRLAEYFGVELTARSRPRRRKR
jgi:plasmid maintenance system antidote protein VapI